MEERTRAFIAIELPHHIRTAILNVQNRLKPGLKGIRWVYPGNIHLTLRFLGDITNSEITAVKAVLSETAREFSPFLLSAKSIGTFPGLNRPRVMWIGLGGEIIPLKDLVLGLENNLEAIGIERDARSFSGHLTIGRVKGKIDPVRILESIKELRDFESEMFSVHQINLYKSDLKPEGPIYTKLFSAEL